MSAAAGKLKKQLLAVKEKAAELQQERVDSDSIIRLIPDRTARISLLSSAAVFLWIAAHAFGLFPDSGFTSVHTVRLRTDCAVTPLGRGPCGLGAPAQHYITNAYRSAVPPMHFTVCSVIDPQSVFTASGHRRVLPPDHVPKLTAS